MRFKTCQPFNSQGGGKITIEDLCTLRNPQCMLCQGSPGSENTRDSHVPVFGDAQWMRINAHPLRQVVKKHHFGPF